ncbi:hypothetical protein PGSY75_1228200 [Plasmodium gaboni]|uniref:Uncharacterized protein n=1 Tax=Plasmodium gaboni TaxID=647221 RepID=A0A151LGM4_9APIC|nr:hypothetical protein PGSY75_1228200 [Plasmodium gaboni]KYN98083.1 hypothetical protein PGSY75_1228200 [Plasmodium gaboni]
MIRLIEKKLRGKSFLKRGVQTYICKDKEKISNNYEELQFLDNNIKHNLYKLKCIEQKKIKSDRIVYKKILKDLLKEKHNLDSNELVEFLYILIYNDLYYLDISCNFFSYFYNNYIFSKKYFNNVNVNDIIHVIYSFYLFENYHFFISKNNFFNLDKTSDILDNEENKKGGHILTQMKLKKLEGQFNNKRNNNNNNSNSNNNIYSDDDNYYDDDDNYYYDDDNCFDNVLNNTLIYEKNEGNNYSFINKKKYTHYYNNNTHSSFHIYNYYSSFIHHNIDYINKNHLIKILLVLSQCINNENISYQLNKKKYENNQSIEKDIKSNIKNPFEHIQKNIFTLIEKFIEKIDLKKDIKKSYTPERINEKEWGKKKERYINLIDGSFKNYIYIDNHMNNNKLVCLFFYVLSNIFYPILPSTFFFSSSYKENVTESQNFTSITNNNNNNMMPCHIDNINILLSYSNNKCDDINMSCTQNENTNDNILIKHNEHLDIIQMFKNHYNNIEEMSNEYYKNTDKTKSSIENFIIYKNNILKSIKKYVFLDAIYNLDVHYKLMFFKSIYTLNFYNLPFLKHIYAIQSYMQYNNLDNLDFYDNLHFFNTPSVHIEINQNDEKGECPKLGRVKKKNDNIRIKKENKTCNNTDEHYKDTINDNVKNYYEKKLKNKLIQLSKEGDLFNNAYIKLLNNIENSIKNNTIEQNINTLQYMYLIRFVDNHFIILLISKLCNTSDKLKNEHKKKMNDIMMSLCIYLSSHMDSNIIWFNNKENNLPINVFNHIYSNNNIYLRHLKKLNDFILLLYKKQIFKRKRKELLSWTNYKCI